LVEYHLLDRALVAVIVAWRARRGKKKLAIIDLQGIKSLRRFDLETVFNVVDPGWRKKDFKS
jgi:hypothetical protein